MGYLGLSALFGFHYQYLNNICVILLSSHGFFSTIVMLIVHHPYREYIRSVFKYQILVWDRGRSITANNLNTVT
uniref:7TM_GPCR_Srx domain-containing protein n=1 Tax=Caenorhabditis tropicalis TaxID=1561998 RepID=A0A1I7SYC4_9PELO